MTSNLNVSTLNDTDRITLSGGLDGAGALTMNGLGTLVLSGTTSTTGGINLNDGTIEFSSGSLGANTLMLSGGRLRWASGNTDDISSSTVEIGPDGATLDTNGNNVTLANPFGNNGSGMLTKSGTGILEVADFGDYSGGTTIEGGTLSVALDGSLGFVPFGPTTDIIFNPGTGNSATLRITAPLFLDGNRNISAASGTAVIDTNSNDMIIPGNISGAGLVQKTGAGDLSLTSVNNVTATGGFTIDAGRVIVETRNNLPGGTITLTGTGGIFNGDPSAYYNLVVNGDNSLVKTYAGNILGLGTISGNGTLTFGGPYVNDFTGDMSAFTGTIITNAGGFRFNGTGGGTNVTLDLDDHGASVRNGATSITLGALGGTSTANLTGSAGGVTQAVTYVIGGKTVDGLGVTPVDSTYNGIISNGANTTSLTKVGASTLTLGGLNTYTGNTSVQDGTLALADDAQLTFKVGASGINNQIGGAGTVTLDGDFNLDLSDPAAAVDGSFWTLVDVSSLASVTFGSTFNIPGFTESADVWTRNDGSFVWTFDESSGELLVTAGTGSPYDTWASGYSLTGGADDDDDLDGIANGIEFVIGGDPTLATEGDKMPTLTRSGGNMVFVFRRTSDSASLNPTVQHNSDLGGSWTTAAHGVDNVTIVEETDGFETGVDKVTVTIPTADAKHFARLNVVVP
jgi:autotransporter-associated beta strand protein